ncbi:restriction endonuclease subunit S [Vibrio rhizosphaerae]|uniref:Restriction endonuclease subunit S n=1 Tax=Vibrio rhizosphaerae TaxID=398736 RepID=A0ABU4ISJ3_9VIBR|nr:restriction endonuclease subunit S [Vibrio rhizosphaerae]MDW6092225.1 restriction endonuclease subunit S [Vibrio rhizosphaerae]
MSEAAAMATEKQAVPQGYKQTEVGVIPEDWELKSLSDVCSFGGGTTPARAQNERYFVGGTHNWIKTTDLNNSKLYESEEKVTDVALVETGLKKHPEGTVLVAMYGGFNQIGRTGVLTRPAAINQALVAIKPNSKNLDSYYLLSELNYNVDYWKGVASSSRKDPNITSNDVKNYRIALPPIKEQTAIANALSDMDTLLTELEQLIAKKQAIKTATMQQLLTGKTRLPQFATHTDGEHKGQPKGMKPSELGEIPEDWEVVTFGKVLTIKHGKNQKEVESENGNYPILATGGQIGNANTYLYDKPSVLIGRKGTINSPKYIETPFWTVDTLFYSEISKDTNAKFIFYKFCMIDWMQYNEASGVPSLNARTIEKVLASLPEQEEQTAIANILSDMDVEIQAFEQRLAKTRQIKQGMMQELLTGKTRLPVEAED